MEEPELTTGRVLELLAWVTRTVLLNNQHKEDFSAVCKHWLVSHGHKFPKPEKSTPTTPSPRPDEAVIVKKQASIDDDPYFKSIDKQVAEINAERRRRVAVDSLVKYNKKPKPKTAKNTNKNAKIKVRRKKG